MDITRGSRADVDKIYHVRIDVIDQCYVAEAQTEATQPSASTRNRTIGYDAMGNRTSLQHVLSPGVDQSVQYTHNKLNQMTGMSVTASGATTNTAFSYDASGNMTAQAQNSGGSTYLYDDADRLISLVQKNTSTGVNTKRSDYVYDAFSRKAVSREYSWDATLNNNAGGWVQSEEKRRVYDGMDVVQERDGLNVTKVNYTRSGNIGGLLARSDTNGNYFFSYDGSGNVVGLTDAAQNTVAEYSYDAWGNALRATGVMANVNAYRYSTKEYQSASGLYDYGFRFYSPGLGRWINRDPIEEDDDINLYAFVANSPVNSVDEDGLGKVKIIITIGKGIRRIVTPKQARRFLRKGKDVTVEGPGASRVAKKMAREQWGRKTVRHEPHGKGQKPHYQYKKGGQGHVKYGSGSKVVIPGGSLGKDVLGDNLAGEVVDFCNPLSDLQDLFDLFQ